MRILRICLTAASLPALLVVLVVALAKNQHVAGAFASSQALGFAKGVADVSSDDAKVRVAAAERLERGRKNIVSCLVRIVERVKPHAQVKLTAENLKEPTSAVLAMRLLGEFRATEAVPSLVLRIDYLDSRTAISGRYYRTEESFPAAAALVKIGMPAIGPVLDKLGQYKGDCRGRELCAWVLKKVLGEKLVKMRLQLAVEQAKRDMLRTKEANLRAAMAHFKRSEERAAQERAKQEHKDSNGTKR